ncbi:MAG: toxic anion resistance protein [Oscillospiraceae bacterium]|nr:toxic anion resistance protein [Oscillospiraceae bacterium]
MNINLETIKEFDLNKEIASIEESLNLSSEIKAISRQLRLNDYNSLFSFGVSTSNEISKFCNKSINILRSDNTSSINDLTDKLSGFVSKLEPKDFIPKDKGLLSRFTKKETDIPQDELYKKYTPILFESNNLIVQVKVFQNNLKKSNENLFKLFQNSLAYYAQIRKYSKALELFRDDIDVKSNAEDNFKNMMDKRHYNLKLVENITLQQTVSIKNVIFNNNSIADNMDSFYIATIPLLKQCILNSITLKKQSIRSKQDDLIKKQIDDVLEANPSLNEKLKKAFINQGDFDRETLLKTIEILKSGVKETNILKEKKEKEIEDESNKITKLNDEITLRLN